MQNKTKIQEKLKSFWDLVKQESFQARQSSTQFFSL